MQSSTSLPAPGSLACWWLAIRPKTLFAAVNPVVLGTVIAFTAGGGHWLAAGAALIGALAIQAGTNLANDYWDWKKGADTAERLGPVRVTSAGLLPPRAVFAATLASFGLAVMAGIYLISRGGWPIVVIGVLAIACGFLYTAGPVSLAYLGLGDGFTLIFFGPVACAGTVYVQTLEWNPVAIAAGMALGLFTVALLAVNNLRDRAQDAQKNKRTLAVRFGGRFARWEYALAATLPLLLPIGLVMTGRASIGFLAVTALNAGAIGLARRIFSMPEGRELNAMLGATSGRALFYTLTFSICWVLFHA